MKKQNLRTAIQMDDENEDGLSRLSLTNLERAAGDDEPEYSLDLIKEANPYHPLHPPDPPDPPYPR